MLKYDDILMRSAIATKLDDGPHDTGFINRRTGEIVFLPDAEGNCENWYGLDVTIDSVFDRARIAANQDEWIEIPRKVFVPIFHEDWCERRTTRPRRDWTPCTCGAEERIREERQDEEDDAFIRAFLTEHGLE